MASLPTRALARTARLAKAGVRATGRLATSGSGLATSELADTLGELRGLATKVGQMMSYIEGMTPSDPVAAQALAALRAQTHTSDPAAIRAIVEEELGAPVEERFAEWTDEPLASASLGQVHRARLPDGTLVAVKVQHPGIVEAVAADLGQADRIAAIAKHVARGVPVEALLAEVRERLTDELDYRLEASNQAAYALAFAGDPDVSVPAVHPGWSGSRVLTTTLVGGADLDAAATGSESIRAAHARATWRLFVEGALRTGFMHGDPHPGNLLFQPDGRLIALDFGCVQPLDPESAVALRGLLRAGLQGREAISVELVTMLGQSRLTGALTEVWVNVLAPLGAPTFRVDRDHARKLSDALIAAKHPRVAFRSGDMCAPPWFILAHRTFLGLISVLGRLDVQVDYRTATFAALASIA